MSVVEVPIPPVNTHDDNICPICANEYKYFGVGSCNHIVCHICALRMRALYKKQECALCKVSLTNKTVLDKIVFTSNKSKKFKGYNLNNMKKDKKLAISFENDEIYKNTMALLAFNCPEPLCKTVCVDGWGELRAHVKSDHSRYLCNLCVTHKKVFSHEHQLFNEKGLKKHNSTQDSTFKGHPRCDFCSMMYYGYDELHEHRKITHEQCFLCQRARIQDQYFRNYKALEEHFHGKHYPCLEAGCIERKFVVFPSNIDLQGHILQEHTDLKARSKGLPLDIDFLYARQGQNSNQAGDGNIAEVDLSEGSNDFALHNSFPSLGPHRRFQPPAGFGTLLTAPPSPSNVSGFAPRPQLSSSNRTVSTFPSTSEIREIELNLTPGQTSVLDMGGTELATAVKKVLSGENKIKEFKILAHAFKSGTLSATKFLSGFLRLEESQSHRIKPATISVDISAVWHRVADLFFEDEDSIAAYDNLTKKSKKKGLSIKEFEQMRTGEPKKTAMLRAWNDHKATTQQDNQSAISNRQSGWANVATLESSSITAKSRKKLPSARVMVISSVIKAPTPTVKPASTNWSQKAEAGFVNIRPPSAPSMRQSLSDFTSSIPSSTSMLPLRPSTTSYSATATMKKRVKPITEISFPSLPTLSSGRARLDGAGSNSNWGTLTPEDTKPKVKVNKKGKQILMHFG